MNDNTTVTQGNLIFSLNDKDKTASVIGLSGFSQIISVPRSVTHNNEEFIVTKLSKGSIKGTQGTHTIKFPPDSELRIIETNAIMDSWVMSITIPSSVCEIQEGWCKKASNLNYVYIMPNNKHYKNHENTLVLGKSDKNSDEFDVLVFARKNIEKITIPPNIKIISAYSFSNSIIENLIIPSNVTQLSKGCFSFCKNLQNIEFSKNSQLKIIEKSAFKNSSIENLLIPNSVCELQNGWCKYVQKLKFFDIMENNQYFKNYNDEFIVGKSDTNSDEYDVLVFANKNMTETTIPPNIKIISPYAFANSSIASIFIPTNVTFIGKGCFTHCYNFLTIEFAPDSQLQIIEPYAFSQTNINNISIPIHVKTISESTFHFCYSLNNVEIKSDSELQIIEKNAFAHTSITSIFIPSNVCQLKDGWCSNTQCLSKVTIHPNNKNFFNLNNQLIIGKSDANKEQYDVLLFASRNLRTITIPPFIKYIAAYAFSLTNIENIFIPNHIIHIGDFAFLNCNKLRHVEIPNDSELQVIGKRAFASPLLESIMIPSHVKLSNDLFGLCNELKIIEITQKSDFNLIDIRQFDQCNFIIMIPAV